MTSPGSDIEHPVFARLYDRFNRGAEQSLFPPHREYLAADLHGSVLDVGAGTGSMFPYYRAALDRGDRFELHAVEPDPHMRRRAAGTARVERLPVDLVRGRAEALPYPDGSFDVVVCSLVLCSVADLERALSEVARVLAADGEFRFFEHVRSDGLRGRVESAVSPLWRPVVAGCRIDRRTDEHIARRFDVQDLTVLDVGSLETFPVRRFVRGRARP